MPFRGQAPSGWGSETFGSLKLTNHWPLDNRAFELPTPCYLAAIGSRLRFSFSGVPNSFCRHSHLLPFLVLLMYCLRSTGFSGQDPSLTLSTCLEKGGAPMSKRALTLLSSTPDSPWRRSVAARYWTRLPPITPFTRSRCVSGRNSNWMFPVGFSPPERIRNPRTRLRSRKLSCSSRSECSRCSWSGLKKSQLLYCL